jgi:hypothetical protein
MLDAHYDGAQQTLAQRPEILEQITAARADADRLRTERLARGANLPIGEQERESAERATGLEGALTSAQRFVHGAQEQERLTGQRYTPRQLTDARQAVHDELGTHPSDRDYEQLSYRVDGGRAAWREAGGGQRELLRAQIDGQIDADRRELATVRRARIEPPQPLALPRPHRRRRHPYRRYGEFLGAREHLPPRDQLPAPGEGW